MNLQPNKPRLTYLQVLERPASTIKLECIREHTIEHKPIVGKGFSKTYKVGDILQRYRVKKINANCWKLANL
jgi:hypothetical protein